MTDQTKRHPYADVIIAWANGEQIQYTRKNQIGWIDFIPGTTIDDKDTPDFSGYVWQWRIKPKQQTGWVNIYVEESTGVNSAGALYKTKEEANNQQRSKTFGTRIACIQITWAEGEGL